MLKTSEGCIYGCWGSPSGSERWWRELASHQCLSLVWDHTFQFSLCVLHVAPFCWAYSQFVWKQLVFGHRICEGRHFLCVACISCFQTNISPYQGPDKPARQHTGAAPNFHWCAQIFYQWVMPPDRQDVERWVIRGREGTGLWVPTISFLFWVSYYYTNFLFVWSSVFLTCQQGCIGLLVSESESYLTGIVLEEKAQRGLETWVRSHSSCSPSHLPQCPIPHTLTGSTCTNSFIKLYTW